MKKATENKAESVEPKPDNMCKVPPGLIDAVISYMANSICRTMTLHESSNIVQALTESRDKCQK